ncbi:cysteine proteinase [Corynespora cassiicola Philippines]|uniref:Cysteine proteinase n=1 Tax=Corynespora cassiicola Philippines TaxID=1448308 RepID=A0A2T2P136_CORCC|nr:cysteine proteinase [Corynespora cassiicola Philippines]
MGSTGGDEFKSPQDVMDKYWENLITKIPGKVTNIFPPSLYANLVTAHPKSSLAHGKNAAESYQAAADRCRARVKRIVRECHRTNEKFTDPDFDFEGINPNTLVGLLSWYEDPPSGTPVARASSVGRALDTVVDSKILGSGPAALMDLRTIAGILQNSGYRSTSGPRSVHRIDWIFEKPQFTVDGFSSSDVQQGRSGDCWFIAAVATVCSNPTLMEKICVERDEECGAYGFVFYRDGEWIWTVVDDNLYLTREDFDARDESTYDPTGAKERKYKQNHQTGSDALYYASCSDQNETWLPLLEKAFAKVHGDYHSIGGGFSGEGIEDLTGGVTTMIWTNRILSKDRLWKELLEVNKLFLFSVSSPGDGNDNDVRRGLALSHAYSVLKAVEEEDQNGDKFRLVLVRNPWGHRNSSGAGEWNGPWSDGSSQWTPYWLEKLNHRFGDDGTFWIRYEDMCKHFDLLERTRLFDKEWTVVQHWTSVSVAWVTGYLATKFVVEIKKGGPTVFVLSQLDDRYFRGFEGKYMFDLHFILQEPEATAGDHIVRARGPYGGNRSISAEVDLEPGTYEVLPKIVAKRDADKPEVYEVVTKVAERNPQKLRQIGMNYDIANAKGLTESSEEERKGREKKRKEKEERKKKEADEAAKDRAEFAAWKERREMDRKATFEEYEAMKAMQAKRAQEVREATEACEAQRAKDAEDARKPFEAKEAREGKEALEAKGPQEPAPQGKEPSETTKKSDEEIEHDGKDIVEVKTTEADKTDEVDKDDGQDPSDKRGEEPEQKSKDEEEMDSGPKSEELKQDLPEPTEGPKEEIEPSSDEKNEDPGQDSPSLPGGTKPASDSDEATDSSPIHTPPPEPATMATPPRSHSPPPPSPRLATSPPWSSPPPPPPPPPPPRTTSPDNKQNPWNAVCVLGLRVYSKDPSVSIKLVRPKNAEEGAVLDADGVAAGATM